MKRRIFSPSSSDPWRTHSSSLQHYHQAWLVIALDARLPSCSQSWAIPTPFFLKPMRRNASTGASAQTSPQAHHSLLVAPTAAMKMIATTLMASRGTMVFCESVPLLLCGLSRPCGACSPCKYSLPCNALQICSSCDKLRLTFPLHPGSG